MSRVELSVGGKNYGGWKTIRIERGIEQIAGTFELGVTDRWDATSEIRQIMPGQECELRVDGQVVITGYVDTVSPSYDKQQHGITVSGRDKTADLVDCSAIHKTGQWAGRKLEQIAADLCKPFGITVKNATDTGKALTPTFSIQEGETVFEALERAARMRAVLLVSDGLGNLILTRAGKDRAANLTEGENILSASAEFTWKDRYSLYVLKGQSSGDDENYADTVAHPTASMLDPAITRYRPIIVMAEDHGSNATLKQRAEWEKSVRMGRGNRATVTVQGWDVQGQLWQHNRLAHVKSPMLGADDDLLIVSVAFVLDESGTRTELQLTRREAFDTLEGVKSTRLDKKIAGKNGAAEAVKGDKKKKQEYPR